ncbi:MAG: hypothetical protein P1T08_12780 [Acidimicrobiia bacterium]|nr:hypothetical protein [Acidimicrobiia bacterium]
MNVGITYLKSHQGHEPGDTAEVSLSEARRLGWAGLARQSTGRAEDTFDDLEELVLEEPVVKAASKKPAAKK